MSSTKKIQFIVNPNSGVKDKNEIVDLIKKEISSDVSFGISFTQGPKHGTELAERAIKKGNEAVIAVGGDGSINEVAKTLVNTEVALGVIPSGSGNGFARHLGIPLSIKEAIKCIKRFKTITIDTATLNGHPFLATAGMGFDAKVGSKFANFGKRGFLSYMQVTAQEYFNFRANNYTLEIDGEKLNTKAFVINIANVGQYGNNAWIAPKASVQDGLLDVCIIEEFPQHLAPDLIYKLFSKQIDKSRYYKHYLAKEIIIQKPGLYHMDGEPDESSNELHIKICPNSLKVIV